MPSPIESARNIANSLDRLLADSSTMQVTRNLVEACLADPALSHIDSIRFSREDVFGFRVTETEPFDADESEAPIMRPEQTAAMMAVLHDIFCPGVDPVVIIASDLTFEALSTGRRAEYERAQRWHLLVEHVKANALEHRDWFERQYRRFESILTYSVESAKRNDGDAQVAANEPNGTAVNQSVVPPVSPEAKKTNHADAATKQAEVGDSDATRLAWLNGEIMSGEQSGPLARILSIIDTQMAEAQREEQAHQEAQRCLNRAASLPVSDEQKEAAELAAAATSDWSFVRRNRRKDIAKLIGELFPTFDDFPLADELIRWGTAHGIPATKLLEFRDAAKLIINELTGWRTTKPEGNPNAIYPDDDAKLCSLITAVRAIHSFARDLELLAKPPAPLASSDMPTIVRAIREVIAALEKPRQWAEANRALYDTELSPGFLPDAFKDQNEPTKAAEQWFLAAVSRITMRALVAHFAPFNSESTVNADARIANSMLDMETKSRLVELWRFLVFRHCHETDLWEAQKSIRYFKETVRELSGATEAREDRPPLRASGAGNASQKPKGSDAPDVQPRQDFSFDKPLADLINDLIRFALHASMRPLPIPLFQAAGRLEEKIFERCIDPRLVARIPQCAAPDSFRLSPYLRMPYRFTTEAESAELQSTLGDERFRKEFPGKHGAIICVQPSNWIDALMDLRSVARKVQDNGKSTDASNVTRTAPQAVSDITPPNPSIPNCPGCGSLPAAIDIDDVCPKCGKYRFVCGQVTLPVAGTDPAPLPPVTVSLYGPHWQPIPPSQLITTLEEHGIYAEFVNRRPISPIPVVQTQSNQPGITGPREPGAPPKADDMPNPQSLPLMREDYRNYKIDPAELRPTLSTMRMATESGDYGNTVESWYKLRYVIAPNPGGNTSNIEQSDLPDNVKMALEELLSLGNESASEFRQRKRYALGLLQIAEASLDPIPTDAPSAASMQAEATAAVDSTKPRGTAKKTKGKRIDERMAKMLNDKPESVTWTAEKWAEVLQCAASTVVETGSWKTIQGARALAEAKRIELQSESTSSDRRRFRKKRSAE